MPKNLRLLSLAGLFAVALHGDDIAIPLENGTIVIQNAQFQTTRSAIARPGLSFTLRNRTSSPWTKLKLQFDIDALCNGERKHWSRVLDTFLGWMGDPAVQNVGLSEEGKEKVSFTVRAHNDVMVFPQGKVEGCDDVIIGAILLKAENSNHHIEPAVVERVDVGRDLLALKAKREADEAALKKKREAEEASRAEERRIAAEEELRKQAAEKERQKRLAAERKKRMAELQAEANKIQAERAAKDAAERTKLRAACAIIYKSTADKKVGDLTVKEEQQVRACHALGMYPPR